MTHNEADSCRRDDLVRGRSAVWFWYLPVTALVASAPMGDARGWIWCPALTLMGAACVANAVRCGRRHCYLTGPVFLIAAALSVLQGTHLLSVGWNWIAGGTVLGWAIGYLLEWSNGSYVEGRRSRA